MDVIVVHAHNLHVKDRLLKTPLLPGRQHTLRSGQVASLPAKPAKTDQPRQPRLRLVQICDLWWVGPRRRLSCNSCCNPLLHQAPEAQVWHKMVGTHGSLQHTQVCHHHSPVLHGMDRLLEDAWYNTATQCHLNHHDKFWGTILNGKSISLRSRMSKVKQTLAATWKGLILPLKSP